MNASHRPRAADLRGAARLATEATAALTDLVEAMHERITRLPGVPPPAAARTKGITGLVYRSVRGVNRLVGGGLDGLLGLLGPALGSSAASAEREALLAVLNGVLGDYLAQTGNPLALPMQWRSAEGQVLSLAPDALRAQLPAAGDRLLLLLHGLCMNAGQWRRDGHDHGAALAAELGYTPVYLNYNSGQHISLNGRALVLQLQQLLEGWPQPLSRVVLLGHSMGGLLARSALHQADVLGLDGPDRVTDLVCLGSPHHGAPLERAGNWIDLLLGASPYAAPLARLGQLRSAGITDLRHGNLLDEDWVGQDRFARRADQRQPVPLPTGMRCYAVAGSLRSEGERPRWLGDGLVPVASALGKHRDPARALHFEAQRQWCGRGINHLQLLSSPQVYARLRDWLA
ncbi:alpha/beta fold hydrolase [Paucibacter sp. APW11]|uniref:Alpha/beta fold hydrolase n=1 Tax=Roseateles aquae TaxID=3077235 RepID=A0ABU3P9Z0_9BURK|nr:alpha/beta fold hydrolase [Paucibacter sp. APW11]MDT8999030.1 alpha/beta fold hydrolase [Paucibacter sp. APW11]